MKLYRKGFWALALGACGFAHAGYGPDPVILTLDGRNHVTYDEFNYNVTGQLVVAFDAQMWNCRRSGGGSLLNGPLRLLYTTGNHGIGIATLRIDFAPTRAIMTTPGGDMICDGEATGGQTGLGRIFRNHFES